MSERTLPPETLEALDVVEVVEIRVWQSADRRLTIAVADHPIGTVLASARCRPGDSPDAVAGKRLAKARVVQGVADGMLRQAEGLINDLEFQRVAHEIVDSLSNPASRTNAASVSGALRDAQMQQQRRARIFRRRWSRK